ncbi:hypothetical protein ACWDTG_25280 [Rhodococcus zopfii]
MTTSPGIRRVRRGRRFAHLGAAATATVGAPASAAPVGWLRGV